MVCATKRGTMNDIVTGVFPFRVAINIYLLEVQNFVMLPENKIGGLVDLCSENDLSLHAKPFRHRGQEQPWQP